jgi:spore maturation protein CgeB
MRVGVIGPVGRDKFADNIAETLRSMGQEVTALGPVHPSHQNRYAHNATNLTRMALPSFDERAQRRIAHASLEAECEVVVNIDLRLMPATVKLIKRDGAQAAFWFTDNVSQLGRQLMLLAPYDVLFFKEPHIVDRVRNVLGLPAYYLPEACNPSRHRPVAPAGTEPFLVVPGTMYPYRVRLLDRLIAKGIPMKLYGAGIPRWLGETPTRAVYAGRYVTGDEKAQIYRSAAGVLNTMHPAEVAGVNGRLFQAAGCGAAVINEFRPKLPEVFDVGGEVLAFEDFDELLDRATRLLNEPGLTAQLGDAAARRAHRDHSYERRLTAILERVS